MVVLPWPRSARFFLPHYARCLAFSDAVCAPPLGRDTTTSKLISGSGGRWLACGDMRGQITLWNRDKGFHKTFIPVCSPSSSSSTSSDNDNDDDSTAIGKYSSSSTISGSLRWINRIRIYGPWLVCGNTESSHICIYNLVTEQCQFVTTPNENSVRKMFVTGCYPDIQLYVITETKIFIWQLPCDFDLPISYHAELDPDVGGIRDVIPLEIRHRQSDTTTATRKRISSGNYDQSEVLQCDQHGSFISLKRSAIWTSDNNVIVWDIPAWVSSSASPSSLPSTFYSSTSSTTSQADPSLSPIADTHHVQERVDLEQGTEILGISSCFHRTVPYEQDYHQQRNRPGEYHHHQQNQQHQGCHHHRRRRRCRNKYPTLGIAHKRVDDEGTRHISFEIWSLRPTTSSNNVVQQRRISPVIEDQMSLDDNDTNHDDDDDDIDDSQSSSSSSSSSASLSSNATSSSIHETTVDHDEHALACTSSSLQFVQHYSLEKHLSHITSIQLINANTWAVADTTWDQLLVFHRGHCVQSLVGNPMRLELASQGTNLAWIGRGSTVWMRDLTQYFLKKKNHTSTISKKDVQKKRK